MMSIRQIRRMREIRQQEMADYLGIHVQTYRKIEEHPETATVEQAKKIAEKLEVSYDDLFFADVSTLSRNKKAETA